MTTPDARPVSEARLQWMIRVCSGEYNEPENPPGKFDADCVLAFRELQSLRAEVERLRATGTESFRFAVYHQDRADKAEARIASLEARNASLEKDAAGFLPVARFLLGEGALNGFWFGERPAGKPQFWWREHLRAAIDAAMKQGKERV